MCTVFFTFTTITFQVVFVGEDGSDGGGLTREFFQINMPINCI